MTRLLRALNRVASQFIDVRRFARGLATVPRFWSDWRRYRKLAGPGEARAEDLYPQLHDRTTKTPFDPHYFYANGWAMRRIVSRRPGQHVDVGSLALFANLLGAVCPVTFVDYRPLAARIDGLSCVGGDILNLPFESETLESVSCIHVAEHIGLGRYGDALDPQGTVKAIRELARIVAPNGYIYFGIPVGRQRTCFNAHRIHAASTIISYFSPLELRELSLVDDAGRYLENVHPNSCSAADYACGLFVFKKNAHAQ
jgi:SAM-dependent methyltransferase